MKTKVYLRERLDFSGRPTLDIKPVDYEKDEDTVANLVFNLIEKELGGKQIERVDGLEQTYIDFEIEGVRVEVLSDPWVFLSLGIPDSGLRKKIWDRLAESFEITPREIDGEDD